jgi:hypothetical protein
MHFEEKKTISSSSFEGYLFIDTSFAPFYISIDSPLNICINVCLYEREGIINVNLINRERWLRKNSCLLLFKEELMRDFLCDVFLLIDSIWAPDSFFKLFSSLLSSSKDS